MNTNFKNILCYILESVILAAFVIFVLICFFFLLSPNLQWMFLLFLVIIPLILAFFAIIEGSYDVYITVLNRKKYNTKPKETKKHFISIIIFIIFSLTVWNFKLYLKDANYLILALMIIPCLKEKNKELMKDIFVGFFLYFILYVFMKEIEPILPLRLVYFLNIIFFTIYNSKISLLSGLNRLMNNFFFFSFFNSIFPGSLVKKYITTDVPKQINNTIKNVIV